AVAVVEDRDVRVGRLAVVLVAEATAEPDNALRHLAPAETPAGDVHLVDALVAQVAVAGVPLPVPVVVELVLVERLHRRRAAPEVIVHALRHHPGRQRADTGAALVAEAAGDLHLPDLPGVDVVDRL